LILPTQEGRGSRGELIAEEMSLRELRKARKLTQSRVAKALGLPKTGLALRTNAYCFYLRKTIKEMGGDVRSLLNFRRAPVVLSQLSEEHRAQSSRECAAIGSPLAWNEL